MRREMSFRLQPGSRHAPRFRIVIENKAGKQERNLESDGFAIFPERGQGSIGPNEPIVSLYLSLSLLYRRELPHKKNALHAII